jgi:hypothetical protein
MLHTGVPTQYIYLIIKSSFIAKNKLGQIKKSGYCSEKMTWNGSIYGPIYSRHRDKKKRKKEILREKLKNIRIIF